MLESGRKLPGGAMVITESKQNEAEVMFAHCQQRRIVQLLGVPTLVFRRGPGLRQAPGPLKTIIINLAPVLLVDVTAVDALAQLHASSVKHGRRLVLAGVRDPVRDTLARASFLSVLGEENIFRNMQNAVDAVTATTPGL